MSEFVYYLLAVMSKDAVAKADELKMSPNSYNYQCLTDPRREAKFLFLVVDRADGYILHSELVDRLDTSRLEIGAPIHIVD